MESSQHQPNIPIWAIPIFFRWANDSKTEPIRRGYFLHYNLGEESVTLWYNLTQRVLTINRGFIVLVQYTYKYSTVFPLADARSQDRVWMELHLRALSKGKPRLGRDTFGFFGSFDNDALIEAFYGNETWYKPRKPTTKIMFFSRALPHPIQKEVTNDKETHEATPG